MPLHEDRTAPRHIEVDRGGRKWAGSYKMSGNEIEVHCAHGTRKAIAHNVPTAPDQIQDYLDGLARLLLVEIIDRHLGLH